MRGGVAPLFDEALASSEGLQAHPLRRQLRLWVDEIICDALATILCGPGFLFAAAAFLPVSSTGSVDSTHPFPRERIRLAIALLQDHGWGDALDAETPQVTAWLDAVSVRNPPESAREQFLLRALDVAAAHVRAISLAHLNGAGLDPAEFSGLLGELRLLLDKGIPPRRSRDSPSATGTSSRPPGSTGLRLAVIHRGRWRKERSMR